MRSRRCPGTSGRNSTGAIRRKTRRSVRRRSVTAGGNWTYLGFNLRRPALKEPLVRKAIAYATDRQGIITGVNYGLGRPLYSPFPKSSWAYDDTVEHYDFDVNKAQDLFKQAGYTLNG